MLQQEQPAANIYMELNFLKRLVFPTEEVFPVHNDFGEEKDTLFIDIIPIEFRFLSIDSNGKCDSGECVCALFRMHQHLLVQFQFLTVFIAC